MNQKFSLVVKAIVFALVCGVIGLGALGVIQLRNMNENALDISENWMPSVRELGELKYRATRLRLVDARYVTAVEPVGELDTVADRRRKDVEAVVARYEPLVSSAQERAIWDEFQQAWKEYITFRARIAVAAQAKDQPKMNELFQSSRKPYESSLDALDRGTVLNVTGSNDSRTRAAETFDRALWLTCFFCLVAVLVGLTGIFYVTASVTRPINSLIQRMRSLAAGDVDTLVPFVGRANEIGAIPLR